MPEKLAKELDEEIERARLEIAALQIRIREMVVRREKAREIIDAGVARAKREPKNDPRISEMDLKIAKAREQMQKFPEHAQAIQTRIGLLETERYRLLLTLEEE